MEKVDIIKYGFYFGIGFESAQTIVYIIADWIKIFLNIPLG